MKIKLGSGALTIAEIANYTNGVIYGRENVIIEYICTDSREADENTLFVAFVGEKVDGHDYIASAYKLGCRCFLAEKRVDVPGDAGVIIVPDSTQALLDMSSEYKSRVNCRRIGITGSVGKTTTKEFIASVVSQYGATHKTLGNYNSTIGMPLTLMETPQNTQVSVIEMAMSGLEEIGAMSRAACPDIAVITNIGSSHMEALGSRENIRKAKLEIIEGLSSDGYLIINSDDEMLTSVAYDVKNIVRIGINNVCADYLAQNIKIEQDGTLFDIKCSGKVIENIKIPIVGKHNVYAALIAAAISDIMGMDECELKRGLTSFVSVSYRQNIISIGDLTVIEDCYNASPESMRAAINVLSELGRAEARKLALLGDMRELGESSEELHREVGRYACSKGIDVLFTIGGLAHNIAAGAIECGMSDKSIYISEDENEYEYTARQIMRISQPGDILLVKASRAIRAERVVECLRNLYDTESIKNNDNIKGGDC